MHRRIGAPRPAWFGQRRAAAAVQSSVFNTPQSESGNASGSRPTRMAAYSAVHGPKPRISAKPVRSVAASFSQPSPSASVRRASADMAWPRVPGMPMAATSACANAAGVGNVPSAKRSHSVVASTVARCTLTCWPKIARVAPSKASQTPGTRSPGAASTKGASVGAKWASIAAGSASKSNRRRMRARRPAASWTAAAGIDTRKVSPSSRASTQASVPTRRR